ncbi:MAG TPA: glutamyl-tRNA reductase [Candidatus Omnitrophota bacterium]|nr:glutamyl-tRNA reductase [Candidatus Omnitrophota bacterium]HNQ50900.1 glutamyl-tRNA reductase [Candidatus Omnitrophota bacterium]HQO37959.1 glutamyl-tRNA reductase [Candidatus Omnitrophota bacterium]HQQ05434.1 glutamyl-tRNA reductase [Candidatus Omnitrophota bacterium]
MNIRVLGLNHKTAPIEIREKVSFPPSRIDQALLSLKSRRAVKENLILSTCNRTELYAVVEDGAAGSGQLVSFLADFHGLDPAQLSKYIYEKSDKDAVSHLFEVVSSLDSMIVGETQIFGQVKDAYFKARSLKTLGRTLDYVFEEAIRVGKKVRSETQIGKGAVSTSTAAIELARKIFETLEGRTVLIIGAGKIGEMTVKNLYSRGVSTILVANRTLAKAKDLAHVFGGSAVSFEDLASSLVRADIIISSTSAPHFVITREQAAAAVRSRGNEPLFFIDLGMPRNIDPRANEIENVYVYNIDDLASVRDANIRDRMAAARDARAIIAQCVESVCGRFLQPAHAERPLR